MTRIRWPIASLRSICTAVTDGSHFSPQPQATGRIIANVKDMRSGRIDFDTCTRIREQDFQLLKRTGCAPHQGDVLLSKDGTIGKVALFKQLDEIVVLSSIAILRPGASIHGQYLAQCLQSPIVTQQIQQLTSGSALRRLVLNGISELQLPLPPLAEQRRIADILDTADAIIQQTEALIAKLKLMRAGLLHDLLTRGLDENGELRDPVAQPEQFKTTPLGPLPINWRIESFDHLAQVVDPQPDHRTPQEVLGGIPYIGVGDFFPDGQIDFTNCRHVSRRALEQQQSRFRVDQGDILFGKIGTIGHPRLLPVANSYALSANAVLIKPKNVSSFVFHLLQSEYVNNQIKQQTHLTSQPAFGIEKIRAMRVPQPDVREQAAIAQLLTAHISELEAEEAYRDKLKLLKQGLMDDLLTGRVRVPMEEGVTA